MNQRFTRELTQENKDFLNELDKLQGNLKTLHWQLIDWRRDNDLYSNGTVDLKKARQDIGKTVKVLLEDLDTINY